MASSDKNTSPSAPITIPFAARGRARSASVSSSSSGSNSSGSELPTPVSTSVGSQRLSIPSPSVSPILSYFMAQSPTTKTPSTATFPFKRKFGTAPVFEEEEPESEIPVAAHARRASATVANRFSTQNHPTPFSSDVANDRGTNLLRRLSLSSAAFVKPQIDTSARVGPPSPPPNSAVSPTSHTAPFTTKPRRSATLSGDGPRPRRAPSPMGERILKGHFDGFN
ncbi:hypothetical protein HYPSUDRAFT_69257 [Hypholoma sublateritium FD-334 SS-4]|uniref:Uncharacterized protein n=1 Tax=Hypholoma sublateritium (strain FD-334 SS-4) TaxID=945553 RepID=A0A0D2KYA6_HYPSF|nr:hypothetical protein HYPSUDRAFT_69257 [Hypholoma sublateritium FD-334 SS-4]